LEEKKVKIRRDKDLLLTPTTEKEVWENAVGSRGKLEIRKRNTIKQSNSGTAAEVETLSGGKGKAKSREKTWLWERKRNRAKARVSPKSVEKANEF